MRTAGAFGTKTLTYRSSSAFWSQNFPGSAGGVYAIILANIAAIFPLRVVKEPGFYREAGSWPAQSQHVAKQSPRSSPGRRLSDLFSDPVDFRSVPED